MRAIAWSLLGQQPVKLAVEAVIAALDVGVDPVHDQSDALCVLSQLFAGVVVEVDLAHRVQRPDAGASHPAQLADRLIQIARLDEPGRALALALGGVVLHPLRGSGHRGSRLRVLHDLPGDPWVAQRPARLLGAILARSRLIDDVSRVGVHHDRSGDHGVGKRGARLRDPLVGGDDAARLRTLAGRPHRVGGGHPRPDQREAVGVVFELCVRGERRSTALGELRTRIAA